MESTEFKPRTKIENAAIWNVFPDISTTDNWGNRRKIHPVKIHKDGMWKEHLKTIEEDGRARVEGIERLYSKIPIIVDYHIDEHGSIQNGAVIASDIYRVSYPDALHPSDSHLLMELLKLKYEDIVSFRFWKNYDKEATRTYHVSEEYGIYFAEKVGRYSKKMRNTSSLKRSYLDYILDGVNTNDLDTGEDKSNESSIEVDLLKLVQYRILLNPMTPVGEEGDSYRLSLYEWHDLISGKKRVK